ncbi:MAG: bifunctional precorrin-2 dehydrogenase/sirohydrochlorin ferrochelatase [Acidimicrobiales bacterium]
MLPLALKLTGKDVLVIGAGRVGTGKAGLLVDAGARVTIITRDVLAELPRGLTSLEEREYRDGDLRGYALVVSATGDAATNDRVVDEARRENIWLNVVDDPQRSDFYFTAVHRAGDVTVSVSTEGASPALAQEVRSMIARSLPDDLADVAQTLRRERDDLHDRGTSTEGIDWRPRIRELLDDSQTASEGLPR